MFGKFRKTPLDSPKAFPPVPRWRPSFEQPLERVVERARHYTNGAHDFAVFQHGTLVILRDGLDDFGAEQEACAALGSVYSSHPDMNPLQMKDGNVLIQYSHDAANIVLADLAAERMGEIDRNHLGALTNGEVLVTHLGPNVFDDFSKLALYGRCYMFMDAQSPEVVQVQRKAA